MFDQLHVGAERDDFELTLARVLGFNAPFTDNELVVCQLLHGVGVVTDARERVVCFR